MQSDLTSVGVADERVVGREAVRSARAAARVVRRERRVRKDAVPVSVGLGAIEQLVGPHRALRAAAAALAPRRLERCRAAVTVVDLEVGDAARKLIRPVAHQALGQ
eukprot:93131-Chlamydomonas_euryale.AAC.1